MADKLYKLTLSLSDGSTINAGTITAPQGPNGANGVTFTPSVSESGVLSWTNNGGLTNPSPISIKGPKGDDAVITESDVEGWGFTRNAGTITEIKMNGESKGINGVVDLGTVLIDASKFATSAQGTNADSALSKANTNATEISTIKTTYQTKTDTTLETTSKTVVGAINEVKGTADNAVQSFEAEATIDDTTGTPTVEVIKSGEGTAPTYTFNFKHLKGADGRQGEAGLVYTKLYSSIINPDVVGNQTITIPTSDFNRTPKTNETFILFNQYGYYLEATVSSITVENNIQVAKCLIVPSKAVNINGTNGADGEEALVCTVMSSLAFEPSTEIGFSLNSFNRTPKPREKFIAFSLECQYATFSVNRVTSQFAYCMTSYVVSTKGQDGVSVTNATAGTPVIDGEKTTTPITFSLSDGTAKEVQVEAQNGNDGKDGAQGATGKDALVYRVLEDTILKKDKTLGLFYEDKLNRIPVVNDTLLIVGSGNQYCIGTVTRVNTITKACDIQCGTVVSTKGETGSQGIGVKSITSGTPTVVNDKTNTPITITLTDNTTVDLVVSAENGKDGTSATVDIVQATGQSESAVMSQKAVTDELNKKATKTYVDAQDDKKLDKAGGTITDNLAVNGGVTIGGNLTVNGTTTTVDSTTLQVKDKLIDVAHGNTTALTTPACLVAPKYDGTNSGALVFDSTGTAYVGDVTLKDGNIDVANSDLQPLATRDGLVGGNLVQYDSSAQTLKDSGKKISDLALKTDIPDSAKHSSKQLATNTDLNTLNSSADIGWYHVGGGNSCAHKPTGVDAFGLEVGRSAGGWFYQVLTSSNASTSRGRRFMRTYSGTAWDGWTKVAITSDIPTVNNGTLTIQKNGTDVATFTANQSSPVTADITVPTSIDGLGGGTLTSPLKVTGGDGANAHKISLDNSNNGQITDKSTATLLGFTDTTNFIVGHKNYGLRLRGKTARPQYTTNNANYNDLALYSDIPDVSGKLDKTTYEVNRTINFGQDGALYIGKFKVYDTNVTFEITSTTSVTYSGKLVIAAQNYVIREAKVYGDAANTVTPNIYIKPSSGSDQYIEVYFKPESWSKNVVHIYGSNIQAEPTNVCTNVPSVPSTATLKPKNALPIYSLSGTTLTITM